MLNCLMGERETSLGQGEPEVQPDRIANQSQGVHQPRTPEEIQQAKDNILEQWRKLSPQEQGKVISGMIDDIEKRMLPVKQVAKETDYSHWRLRQLIRDGKIEGIDFSRGRVLSGVYTTVEAVEAHWNKPPVGFKPWFLEKLRREAEGGDK